MSIVMNQACPACQENGRDQRGNHLMVFEDGGMFCNKAHHHTSGDALYIPAGSENPILGLEINGTIKYTEDQFKCLLDEGKLDSPVTRAMALSGMRVADRLKVANEDEIALMLKERKADNDYYEDLTTRNLKSRHIRGEVAKFYGVRVGLDENKSVARHYYPSYLKDTGEWSGAKCRTLPKDFKFGHLGWTHGDLLMFGQNTTQAVSDSGQRYHTLTLVGGELDALAAQQMLRDASTGKYKDQWHHVWSPNKGECALEEIILNKEAIDRFKKIIVAADDDETGRKFCMDIARLFRGKVHRVVFPTGMKDPNDCLMHGHGKEFVDAWWNPVSPFEGGKLKELSEFKDKAKRQPTMGLSWPWPDLNPVTYGIQLHSLIVWGAGTGVGKTATTKEVVHTLTQAHEEQVEVIYLEERPEVTLRSYAGLYINKDLNAPPTNDPKAPDYDTSRDYTVEEADAAIDALCDEGNIVVADLEGRKDVDSVMDCLEEGIARGIKYFIVDNLTAFEHTGKDGKAATKVEAIDETMRRLGTLKDEHSIHIMLLSHLKKINDADGNSHAEGAEVRDDHFRGAGSITFWANGTFGIERNTKADGDEKLRTTYRSIKNRTVGYMTNTCVQVKMDRATGRLIPDTGGYHKGKVAEDFDTGEEPPEF